jgi:hypothetical protein
MKKHNISKTLILLATASLLFFNACKKHDDDHKHDDHDHDNELITTVRLQFVDSLSKDTFNYTWSQPGGPGSAVSIDTIGLEADRVYLASVDLLDKSKNPVVSVSEAVLADANSHRFIYTSSLAGTQIRILDFDQQVPAMELGLKFRFFAANTGTGNFICKLRHYTASSPKSGGLANGSTDIEVEFPIVLIRK